MGKKRKKSGSGDIPSWIKDLYREDLDRVVRGERPMYFRGMEDTPLANVSPELDVMGAGALARGLSRIPAKSVPSGITLPEINRRIGEAIEDLGVYLPEKVRPLYKAAVEVISHAKDKGIGAVSRPLTGMFTPEEEKQRRRLAGEYPIGYVDAIDGIWPKDKYGLWGENLPERGDGGEIGDADKERLIAALKSSKANFARRLLDPNRKTIPDWDSDMVATHKMGWTLDDGKYLVFPMVQEIDGELHDFTDPKYGHGKWDALDSAIQRGDTLEVMSEDEAGWLTNNYKRYFETFKEYEDGGPVEDLARKMYREDLDRVIAGEEPVYYGHLKDKPLEDTHPEFDVMGGGLPMRAASSATSKSLGLVGKDVFTNPWESTLYGRIFDKLDDYGSVPNQIFTKYLGKALRGIKKRIPDKEDKKRFQSMAEKVVDRVHDDLDYYVGLGATMLADDKEEKAEGGYVASRDNTSVGGPGTNLNVRYDVKPYQSPLSDIMTGFIPGLDIASDMLDMSTAVENDDRLGMALASLGLLPVVGGAASYANKARRSARAVHLSEPPDKPVYYRNKLSGGVTHGGVVDGNKDDLKLMSNIFFERGFYPRFERMMDELGKSVRQPYKSGMLLEEDKDFIRKMRGKDGNVAIPEKGTPLRNELNRMLSDRGISDQESAWRRWVDYANSKRAYDNREGILDGVRFMVKNPDTYDFDLVDGLSMNGHALGGVYMKNGNRMLIDANLPYENRLTTMIHETRHKIGRYIDDTFGKAFDHGLTRPAGKTMNSLYRTLNYDDFLDNANHMWDKSATNAELQFLMEKLRGYTSMIDGIGDMYGDRKMRDIVKNVSDDDIKSLLGEIKSDYSGKYIEALDKGEMSYDDVRKALMYPIVTGLMYGGYDRMLGDGNNRAMAEGGPVETNRPYGAGKYVIDPERAEDSRMVVYDEIWDYLTEKKGIAKPQAIGILSNIAAESGGDITALGSAGDFGIQQWLGPRKKELQRRYGKKPTLTQQLDYLIDEYRGKVPGLGWNYMSQGKFFGKDTKGNEYNYYMYSKSDFDNATNYKDATVAWNQGFGRPLGSTLRNERRLEFSDRFAKRYGVKEDGPMRYGFGQAPVGDGGGGTPTERTPATPQGSSVASSGIEEWWENDGKDLLYQMLYPKGMEKKDIDGLSRNISTDTRSMDELQRQEDMMRERARRELVLDILPSLSLDIKGMSGS